MTLEALCEAEAARLHVFLEDWLVAALPRTAEAFGAFADAIAEPFVVIGPSGGVTARAALLTEFEAIHGAVAADRGAFRIWIERYETRRVEGGLLLATYEEWHRRRDETSARLATVLYRARPEAPGGVEWLHVHETWLPGMAPKSGERFPEPA